VVFNARAGERFPTAIAPGVDQHGHAEQHEADFKRALK